ncbi:MAG TPA: alpha/beta hydrolase [Dehalococcoidia bacterium]|nr:alpha/beta hydrolase [Dehalococcoidia bacterium]
MTSLDPAVFRPESIDPETAAFNAQWEAMFAGQPPTYTQKPADVRAARAAGKGPRGPIIRSPNAKERVIDGPAGHLSMRMFLPPRVEGVYLHIHGGGWVLGSSDAQDERLERICNACNLVVLSVEYRLAPEDPYPAGPDDCEAAAVWLAKNAQSEYGTDRLLIGGESAGAHLAVVTALRLRDRHGLTPFSGAYLGYGLYDPELTPSARRWGNRTLVLNTPVLDWFSDHFVPPALRRDPDVNPLFADLTGMPPALFVVGTLDPLLDDTLFMHARWLAAANQAELNVYPGGIHGLDGLATTMAKTAQARQEAFFTKALSG